MAHDPESLSSKMAQFERDNAPASSTSEEQRRPARSGYRPTENPLFVSRGTREPINFATRTRRGQVQHQQDVNEGSSQAEDGIPTMTSGGSNWLNKRNGSNERKFGFGEVGQRTDDNGGFRPKTVHGSAGPHAGRQSPLLESRIPRSRTFSPGQKLGLSPPRTLTDAYRMAEREEKNIPVPMGSSDSESTGPRQGSPSPAARDRRRPNYQRMRSGGGTDSSPIIGGVRNRELEKSKGWGEMVDVAWAERARTRSGSGSGNGSPPLVEDQDDEYAKIRAKRARDEALRKRAIERTTPLFASIHNHNVGERVAETTKTLEKKTSETYLDAEPPLNIPRQWGTKARRRADWITKILSPESSVEVKDLPPAVAEEVLKSAADIPLPSVEAGSEPTPPSSRPTSAQPINASPEKSRMWDADLDFTAQSLQISTSPQLRVKSDKLDQLRDREIQSLTARAVATNRLEEIRERNSEERSVLSESSRVNLREPTPEPTKIQETEEPYHERTILEEEGEHIRGTPITIFSGGSYRGSNSSSRERSSDHDREESAGRPGHKRDDSLDILRRLSRAASASPAPPRRTDKMDDESSRPRRESAPAQEPKRSINNQLEKAVEKPLEKREEKPSNKLAEKSIEKPVEEVPRINGLDVQVETKRSSRSSSRPRSEVDPEERITAEAKLFDPPDSKSERNSVRAPSPSPPSSDDEMVDETPRPKQKDPLSLPTPRVTGAFIETPAPTVRKPRKMRTISPYYETGDEDVASSSDSNLKPQNSQKAELRAERRRSRSTSSQRETRNPQLQAPEPQSRPPLINTANPTSASEDLRRIRIEAQIEDSTLDDFDGLLDADVGNTVDVGNTTAILEPLLDLEYDEKGLPLSRKERERRLERLTLDRMNQHLKNTSSSIRDARQGIERLEHQVSSVAAAPPAHKPEEDQLHIKIPVPRLWIKDLSATAKGRNGGFFQRNWKFTWLGFILFIFSAWFLAETTVCEIYCHPIQSSRNTWQPSDPFFPWAIPTKLDQWTGEIVSTGAGSVWGVVDGLMGPKRARRRWGGRTQSFGASDWWLGRDGPVGIIRPGNEGSIFNDEVI